MHHPWLIVAGHRSGSNQKKIWRSFGAFWMRIDDSIGFQGKHQKNPESLKRLIDDGF